MDRTVWRGRGADAPREQGVHGHAQSDMMVPPAWMLLFTRIVGSRCSGWIRDLAARADAALHVHRSSRVESRVVVPRARCGPEASVAQHGAAGLDAALHAHRSAPDEVDGIGAPDRADRRSVPGKCPRGAGRRCSVAEEGAARLDAALHAHREDLRVKVAGSEYTPARFSADAGGTVECPGWNSVRLAAASPGARAVRACRFPTGARTLLWMSNDVFLDGSVWNDRGESLLMTKECTISGSSQVEID